MFSTKEAVRIKFDNRGLMRPCGDWSVISAGLTLTMVIMVMGILVSLMWVADLRIPSGIFSGQLGSSLSHLLPGERSLRIQMADLGYSRVRS